MVPAVLNNLNSDDNCDWMLSSCSWLLVMVIRSGASGLKASQTYPPKYGLAMAKNYNEYIALVSEIAFSEFVAWGITCVSKVLLGDVIIEPNVPWVCLQAKRDVSFRHAFHAHDLGDGKVYKVRDGSSPVLMLHTHENTIWIIDRWIIILCES